ncbi:myomegalin isoform X2 [Hippocampus comes]|uniref:myomegalin isoform X2 n=1 Tax=Hippocampus comes TaxID=109280 RepID=UPI00094E1669|nr:PREDICTED: myomegalin-like isoform X2 [Hippocampus comes]
MMTEFSCDDTDKGPLVQMHCLRGFERHLNDLKKENFSLKLRIYFLEEKIEQTFEQSSDDMHKKNIQLKVEVESLKNELSEKKKFLDTVPIATENLSPEEKFTSHSPKCQKDISPMQEILQTKVELLPEEAQPARDKADHMALLAYSETKHCQAQESLYDDKDRLIDGLVQKNQSLSLQVEQLEVKVQDLFASLLKKEEQIEDYLELLEVMKEKRDPLFQKLRQRLKERDKALERAVDDKFHCIEEKMAEMRQLHKLLREKESELERQRCVLANNEGTIKSLELLLCDSSLELEQMRDACGSIQQQQQESQQRQKEKDAILNQLQVALQARTQEVQDLRSSLLTQLHSGPSEVLEELNAQLQLKDHLVQQMLADQTQQAQQHQEQVKDLFRTISTREHYFQHSANQFGKFMAEQTARLQDIGKQLISDFGSRLRSNIAMEIEMGEREMREKENQEPRSRHASRLDSPTRIFHVNSDIIKDLQKEIVDPPSDLPLVENLSEETQVQRESPSSRQLEFGVQLSSKGKGDADEDPNTKGCGSLHKEKSKLMFQPLVNTKASQGRLKVALHNNWSATQSLTEVKQLVEQKRVMEKELGELKDHLNKMGFSSLSQIRKALVTLYVENKDLNHPPTEMWQHDSRQNDEGRLLDDKDEEEIDVTMEEGEDGFEFWDAWDEQHSLYEGKHSTIKFQTDDEEKMTEVNRSDGLYQVTNSSKDGDRDLSGNQQQSTSVSSVIVDKTVCLRAQCKELNEKLTVSDTRVKAQPEKLKEHREMLTETTVQQDNKQIQVDLQDMGYETCGRSENEAEREDTSSPEFDDLEMCTSLDCPSQWWPACRNNTTFNKTTTHSSCYKDKVSSLQRLIEDLRAQLSHSRSVIHSLQSCLHSVSTSDENRPQMPQKDSWSSHASPSVSMGDDDEGWQSSDGGPIVSLHHPNKSLKELMSHLDTIDDQIKKRGKKFADEDGNSLTWPSKFHTLIQTQARELSVLRQHLREGRGVCHILSQHLGETTKAFEELLRANDVDYYMGQSFRDQLAQSSTLAQKVSKKISTYDWEDPDEKPHPLAIWLSKELQLRDKVIESLHAQLNQPIHNHPLHRSNTPCSCHALSDTTDELDQIFFVSDGDGSTENNPELCFDADTPSDPTPVSIDFHSQSSTISDNLSFSPASPSFDKMHSGVGTPSLQFSSSSHRTEDTQSQTGISTPSSNSVQGVPFFAHQQPVSSSFIPNSFSSYQPPLFSSHLDAISTMKEKAGSLENSVLWQMSNQPQNTFNEADILSETSGYHLSTNHTASYLIKEHLLQIRSLEEQLEDSIQTNDRLRQQLEDKLAPIATERGAPTNISLDSVDKLSNDVRIQDEENSSPQRKHLDTNKVVEQMQEVGLLDQNQRKETELEVLKWMEHSRNFQTQAEALNKEITELKQVRLRNQDTINRLKHEVSILQQQLCESRSLGCSLQCELLEYHRGAIKETHAGQVSDNGHDALTLDSRELYSQLEKKLNGETDTKAPAKRNSFSAKPILQGRSPDVSFVHHNAGSSLVRIQDVKALQQQILEGSKLLYKMEATLYSWNSSLELNYQKPPDSGSAKELLIYTQTLHQILNNANSVVQTLWRAALPNTKESKQDESQTEEVLTLRQKLSEQQDALKDAIERVRTSNQTKDSMEQFIVNQLSRTRDVLKKAKKNLQENEVRISSLHLASVDKSPLLPLNSLLPNSHAPDPVKLKMPLDDAEKSYTALACSCEWRRGSGWQRSCPETDGALRE